MKGKLYGIGVGPGDPELLTLKAKRILDEADIIAVMTPGHAAALAAYGTPPEKIRLLGGGIPDPYGGNTALYRQTRDALELAVDALAEELLGK